MTTTDETTREQWLEALADLLRPYFSQAGYPIPLAIRYSCSWPSKLIRKRIGECWDKTASADLHNEVFISPLLDNPIEVGATLVHELCHATVGLKHGHKGPFRKCAQAVGLEGKMTATTASPALVSALQRLTTTLPPYPHRQLDPGNAQEKKQTTRLLRVACPDCGYLARITLVWITEAGCPTCPCGTLMAYNPTDSESEDE